MIFSNVKTALVDFDGTLIDSTECWTDAYKLLCEHCHAEPSADTVRLFDEVAFEEWQNVVFKQLGCDDKDLLEFAKIAYAKRSPNKSVLAVLELLPCDCTATVITKEPKELVEFWLAHYGIVGLDGIVTVGDERKNAEYYATDNLLLIDDNYKHCIAAKAAGAVVIGVNARHTDEQAKAMRNLCDAYIEP